MYRICIANEYVQLTNMYRICTVYVQLTNMYS